MIALVLVLLWLLDLAVAAPTRPSADERPRSLWSVVDVDGKLTLRHTPHEGQQAVLDAEERFILMLAGSQGGKTSTGPVWLKQEIDRCGPGDYLAVTSTYPLLELKMLPEFERYFHTTLRLGYWRKKDKLYVLPPREKGGEETRIIFGSATNPDSLEAATAKAAWLDEAGQNSFPLGAWEAVIRRLTRYEGRVLLTTTPYNLGWLKQQLYDAWKKGDPTIRVVQFASNVNPSFPEREFQRLRAKMAKWKFDMFHRGMFERPEHMIYRDYVDEYREEGGHVVHPFEIPSAWEVFGGVDFGAVNTARLLAARDPKANVYYLWSEYHEGGRTSAQHAQLALDAVKGRNMRVWYGGAKSETQQRMDWNAVEGMYLNEPEVADVEAGIDRVIALLKSYRLYVFDSLAGVRDEFGRYMREVDKAGNTTEKIAEKERFHLMDALRYLTQGLDQNQSLLLWGEEDE